MKTKFAIKHKSPSYYLEKDRWNWTDVLDEKTVYDGDSIARRLVFESNRTLKEIAHEISIVPLEEAVVYRESQ